MHLPAGGSALAGRDLFERLERLVRLIRRLDDPGGLSTAAALTLSCLLRDGPTSIGALAQAERVTQPNMTQLVARLERAGCVDRMVDPDDGRVVLVRITDEGREVFARRRELRARFLNHQIARLDEADRRAITAALPALDRLAALDADPANA